MKTTEQCTEPSRHPKHHPHTVNVDIDGNQKRIPSGCRKVAELKALLGVPPDYELEKVEGGHFQPLDDAAEICIEHHEKFVSHVKTGSSS